MNDHEPRHINPQELSDDRRSKINPSMIIARCCALIAVETYRAASSLLARFDTNELDRRPLTEQVEYLSDKAFHHIEGLLTRILGEDQAMKRRHHHSPRFRRISLACWTPIS